MVMQMTTSIRRIVFIRFLIFPNNFVIPASGPILAGCYSLPKVPEGSFACGSGSGVMIPVINIRGKI